MQKHSYYLTKLMAERGHKVTLIHCTHYSKPLPSKRETSEALSIKTESNFESIAIRFPKGGLTPGHYLKESYQYSKDAYDIIKSRIGEFDFIYAKGFSAWYLLNKKKQGQKTPPIGVKFHGYEMFQKAPSFKARIEQWMLRGPVSWNNLNADYVFSYGARISQIIERIGVNKEKIIEIPTGIESSWLKSSIEENIKLRFVFVGRYERRKGVQELHKALNMIGSGFDYEFHFIGPIPDRKRIVRENVFYHGSIVDIESIKKILDICQVMVVPSHSEGMPNVIMEAMARGLAVVTTPVGAIEAVVDDSNGWFFPPGDTHALKALIEQILKVDRAILHQKQLASLSKIQGFLWENVIETTIKEIEILLNKYTFANYE